MYQNTGKLLTRAKLASETMIITLKCLDSERNAIAFKWNQLISIYAFICDNYMDDTNSQCFALISFEKEINHSLLDEIYAVKYI